MNKLVMGLKGVEVIGDDFLICTFGDNNLHCFLERARNFGLKLNLEKVKLWLDLVPFIGHLFTSEGLAPDPNNTSAVTNMAISTKAKSLQQLLGMAQYQSKFFP